MLLNQENLNGIMKNLKRKKLMMKKKKRKK
jgi:hypothetical protein